MSATFWTLMIVSLNTPRAAVEIRQLPESPAFQTKASCEDYAKLKSLQGTVCFMGGAPLRSPLPDEKKGSVEPAANVWISGDEWQSTTP